MNEFEIFSFSGESIYCYGLLIVQRALERLGFKIFPFDPKSKRPILVSLYWQEQIYDFVKWRYSKSLNGRQIIVGGNYASTSPQSLLGYDCSVYLGDGEMFDGSFDNEFIIKSGSDNLPRARALSKYIIPFNFEDVQQTRRSFCEMSRGCKYKCLFCQYGWLKPYRESSITDIKEVLKRTKTKSIRAFAADRYAHSKYIEIRNYLNQMGKNDTGSDCTVRQILNNPELLKYTKKVRVGIEGISDRLRTLVGKNIKHDEIVKFCKLVADYGIKSLDFYMIYGLPTEQKEEIEEFEKLITDIDAIMPEGYNICIHWNAFTPSSQTPFQWAKPAIGNYDWLLKFMQSKPNKKIKIYHKPKLTSEWTILRRMLAIRADERINKLIYNVSFNENKFKKNNDFILKHYQSITGMDLIGEWDTDLPLPWDKYCKYNKEKMLTLYKRKVKMAS
jgi:radical SAM superfamily enzyme YgiQ (UPF0313 family)